MNGNVNPAGNGNGTWRNFYTGFNIGHLLILLGMTGAFIWWFVNYDRELTISKLSISAQVQLLEKLTQRVDGIDEHGTHYSQSGLNKETASAIINADRISKLEAVNLQVVPRIERMDTNLAYVMDWVKEQKEQNKQKKDQSP